VILLPEVRNGVTLSVTTLLYHEMEFSTVLKYKAWLLNNETARAAPDFDR
jgi:hypothetical protein